MPATVRARNTPAAAIGAVIVATSLGPLLVAASAKGVVFTAFGDSEEEVRAEFCARFPHARSGAHTSPRLSEWAAAATEAVESGDSRHTDTVPVHLTGTPFQLAVWKELAAIPCGTTISYGELARRAGRPTAVRAAAQACGANPVGVFLPCHRVIGANGSLTGFASGIDRKRALLEREGAL